MTKKSKTAGCGVEMAPGIQRIDRCRLSGSRTLVPVLNLGDQALTGVFPKSKDARITRGPLEIVWCPDSGLLQLAHSYPASEMYGANYGYRSGLNRSMVDHLSRKIRGLEKRAGVQEGDIVLDIGSNDGTSLGAYLTTGLTRVGIDPTAGKFRDYYPPGVEVVVDFFSAASYQAAAGSRKARVVTSIAMFYDLEDPVSFARDVASVLHPSGIWHLEQHYAPSMLRTGAYDAVCHEHIEYYTLGNIMRIVEAAGLRVLDVEMNAVNGGSFAVDVGHRDSPHRGNRAVVEWLISQEERMGLSTPAPFRDFEERVYRHRQDLRRLLESLRADGKRIHAYGASTKGNVVLQFAGIGPDLIECVAEVNEDKFGAYTPGTGIPIVSEAESRALRPDYFLVLPWHFKDGILRREEEFRSRGGKIIFPFPEIEIV